MSRNNILASVETANKEMGILLYHLRQGTRAMHGRFGKVTTINPNKEDLMVSSKMMTSLSPYPNTGYMIFFTDVQ